MKQSEGHQHRKTADCNISSGRSHIQVVLLFNIAFASVGRPCEELSTLDWSLTLSLWHFAKHAENDLMQDAPHGVLILRAHLGPYTGPWAPLGQHARPILGSGFGLPWGDCA